MAILEPKRGRKGPSLGGSLVLGLGIVRFADGFRTPWIDQVFVPAHTHTLAACHARQISGFGVVRPNKSGQVDISGELSGRMSADPQLARFPMRCMVHKEVLQNPFDTLW